MKRQQQRLRTNFFCDVPAAVRASIEGELDIAWPEKFRRVGEDSVLLDKEAGIGRQLLYY
jgi:hypothetical protein